MNGVKSLFLLNADEIEIGDIVSFCAHKIPEGLRLDYKDKLNKDVLKAIAAMANTDGGLILVGVPEEKEEGGRRSFPGMPKGIPVSDKPKEKILNWCYSTFQPIYSPEILEITTNDPQNIIVLIRVDRNQIPELPIFHQDDESIYIRLDDQSRRADREHIRLLFEKEMSRKNEIHHDISLWLPNKLPNKQDFCWLSVGIFLPKRNFAAQLRWNSNQISILKEVVENHEIQNIKIWTQYFCPFFSTESLDIETTRSIRDSARNKSYNLSIIKEKRGERYVYFRPDPVFKNNPLGMKESDPQKGGWFDIWFDANGYLLATIGFPWYDTMSISLENIYNSFYSIMDLFTQPRIKECYRDFLWGGDKFMLFAIMSQFPGILSLPGSWSDVKPPEEFSLKGASWSGPHETEIFNTLNPKTIANHFSSRLLAWAGFLNYEEKLQSIRGLID